MLLRPPVSPAEDFHGLHQASQTNAGILFVFSKWLYPSKTFKILQKYYQIIS
jgi:hypothetical protein